MPSDNTSNTSWGGVSEWYNDLLSNDPDSYQKQVILPNLLRILDLKPGEKLLDLACGSGFFSEEFAKTGAAVTGVDISPELIALAEKRKGAKFVVSPAEKFVLEENSFNKIVTVLAIQNIEDVKKTLENCAKMLVPGGKFVIVMNHPSFRIPKASAWGWDEVLKKQYRRIDSYLSESKEKIDMTPGAGKGKKFTISFHRPLQYYFKLFGNAGLRVNRLEEWTSHKKSEPGTRQKEEDRMRKEIPMFLCIELSK